MADRITHEHPSIRTVRGRVVRHGGSRRRIVLPIDDETSIGPPDIYRCVVEGSTYFAPIEQIGDELAIFGLYDSHRRANTPSATGDQLREWLDSVGLSPGSTVAVDIVDEGERIGLRPHGGRGVYTVESRPHDSLQDIADRYFD